MILKLVGSYFSGKLEIQYITSGKWNQKKISRWQFAKMYEQP